MNPKTINEKKILVVVPARAGSKGLPNKNILICAGKPLIAWTIEAASRSRYVGHILVSTDSESIASVAREYGAWVPFIREPHLAEDDSSVIDVLKNSLEQAEKLGVSYDYVMLLQPTSPLRATEHINKAFEMFLLKSKAPYDTLVSVKTIDNKMHWLMGEKEDTGYLYSLTGLDMTNPRRQKLPKCYLPNGAIYLAKSKTFSGFYSEQTIPYIMDEESSLDVDYLDDLQNAEKILNENQS